MGADDGSRQKEQRNRRELEQKGAKEAKRQGTGGSGGNSEGHQASINEDSPYMIRGRRKSTQGERGGARI
jgi:hypothetical protein